MEASRPKTCQIKRTVRIQTCPMMQNSIVILQDGGIWTKNTRKLTKSQNPDMSRPVQTCPGLGRPGQTCPVAVQKSRTWDNQGYLNGCEADGSGPGTIGSPTKGFIGRYFPHVFHLFKYLCLHVCVSYGDISCQISALTCVCVFFVHAATCKLERCPERVRTVNEIRL